MGNVPALSKSSLFSWMKMLVFVILTSATPFMSAKAEASSPPCGLTIITHGYSFFLDKMPGWLTEMGNTINCRMGGHVPIYTITIWYDTVLLEPYLAPYPYNPPINISTGKAIVLVDWTKANGGICYPTATTRKIGNLVYDHLRQSIVNHNIPLEVPIHLIGHSRGASVMSQVAKRCGSEGIWVDQLTTLDPHPFLLCTSDDTEVSTWDNILFADNYYQKDWSNIDGDHVPGTYEINLTNIVTGVGYGCDFALLESDGWDHEQIHTFYHGTISIWCSTEPTPLCVDNVLIQDEWYKGLPGEWRRETGYYFSRTGSGDRYKLASSGLHYRLNEPNINNRESLSITESGWPNATFKPFLNESNYNMKVGTSVDFTYFYQDADSNLDITFALDNDTNPFNNTNNSFYKEIGTSSNLTKRNTISAEAKFPWTPNNSDVGYHYVQIKATDGSHVRYDYLLKPINVIPATQLPSDLVVENLLVTPSSGEPGSNTTISFKIRNNGDIAYPSDTNIRLSASSSNVTVNDTLLASIEIPQIAKGAIYQVSQNVVIPGVGASGIYYVWVILDVNNEANQGGNTYNDKANQPFVITVPPPPSAIGNFVQVYNAGTSGLHVRSPNACDSPLIGQNRFDGVVGKVIDGPQTCNIKNVNYTMWKVQWNDCIIGWSAQDWMKKIQSANISCGTTYAIIRLDGDLNFGAVQVGSSVQRTMTIYNDGNSTLTVSSISYPLGFSGNWSGTIGAGSSRQVPVTFSPTEQKTYGGNVTVTSNASSGTNTRPVSGTGTITSTRILRLEGNLNFGEVQVGSNAQRPMTIYNDGNSALTVRSIGYPEGFSGDWHGSIAAGSSRQVTVTFSPTATKAYSGNVIVDSDASGANTLLASGTGIIAQTRTIRLTGDLNFGEVQVGHSATRTMTIFNNGNLTLTVNSISYPPGFSGAWNGIVEGNSSHSVPVTFSPTEEKIYSGNVDVNSNATSGTNTLPVSGSGTVKSIFTLTVASSSPDNGINITVSPGDNNGKGSDKTQFTRTYNNNTPVKLTAPSTAGGKNFQKWQCNGVDWTTSQVANVTMDADYIMTAVYPTPVYTIGVGDQPFGIGVNPQTNRIYVANTASDNVSVIDGETNKVIATIGVGDEPKGVGVNPATNRIYVSNQISNTVSVIDGMSNKVVATVENVLSPIGIGVNPTTNRIYVANFISNTVSVIDGVNNNVVSTVVVGMQPVGVDVNPQTNRMYVANAHGGTVSVINGANNQVVATVGVGNTPLFVGANPQTNRIYVSDQNNDIVSVINGENNTVIATVGVGDQPMGIGVNPQTNRIYVANSGYSSSSVSVIDGAINQVVVTVGVEANTIPRGIGVNPQTNCTYVSNQGGDMISVIDWLLPTPTPTVTPTPIPTRIIRLEGDLNFGTVQVGSNAQRPMTIYNDGNSTMTVSSISYPTGFSGNWSGTIAAVSSQQVTVTFSPAEQKTYSGNVTVTSDATSGINTRPVSGTGTIKPISTLTVASSNPNSGVSITVSPDDNSSQGNGATQFKRTYNKNTTVTLTAPSTAGGNTFQKWQRNGVDLTTSQTTNVTMNADYTMTAVYVTFPTPTPTPTPTRVIRLDGDLTFGEVQVGSSAPRAMTIYNDGNSTLTVSSISYPTGFSGNWSGTIGAGSLQQVTVTFAPTEAKVYSGDVTVNSDKTSGTNTKPVTGTGAIKPISTLTVDSSNPNSGVPITVGPNDNSGQGSGTTLFTRTYNNNTAVTLTAPPTAGGNNFQRWQRNGVDLTTSQTANVTMNTDCIMTAVYAPISPTPTPTSTPVIHDLTVSSSNPNSGVSITVSPNDNNSLSNGTTQFTRTYNNNTAVTLTAPPNAGGNSFQKWQRNGVDLTTSQTANVTMDANYTMMAVYAPISPTPTPTPTSTPGATGNIAGQVTDSMTGAGINDATVMLDTGESATSSTIQGQDGIYTITGVSVGQHKITAFASNYATSSQVITVVESDPNPQTGKNIFNFALKSTGKPTPTPPPCEQAELDAVPESVNLVKESSHIESVTVTCEDGAPVAGIMVTATVRNGKKRVSVSPSSAVTDTDGQAMFTITAKKKAGNAKVRFETADGLRDNVSVKVSK